MSAVTTNVTAPSHQGLRAALDAAVTTLNGSRVATNGLDVPLPLPTAPNVSMFRPRDVYGVIRPTSTAEVQDIVRTFADCDTKAGLHVVSTGRNWGLGSREPAADGAVTLDLAGLDQIRRIDLTAGWAVVEPGVTQAQLAKLLDGTPRMLNVTASSQHTSVLGNTVDRGVGLRRQRTEDLVGLEVVLPDGELVRVGWWPEEHRTTAVNRYGLGPSALHLFTQSNLGVVTAAVVRLLPRPEAQYVLRLAFGQEYLAAAIDEMRRWVAQGLVSGVLKVYDVVSTQSYGGRPGEYLAHLCVEGTPTSAAALLGALTQEADRSGLFTRVTRSDQEAPSADDAVARAVEHAFRGDPSHNEHMLKSAVGQSADRVDAEGGGWLFFLPLVPFTGDAIARTQQLLTRIHEETGIRAGSTINALDADVIDLVVSVKFERTSEQTERAHRALDLAYELFSEAGFVSYRLDSEHQEWVDELTPDATNRAFARRLKQLIDPAGVIAPGRYA
ncbi:FAD-binding oxidoreductase [Streptomyces sp. NBC_00237]|uniref:FAD-binding oxidoreductase n=1 Tax=Streptomyces sp. NBC_00237 TaxID=2975687 RepID=UPI0022507654|nr:FAD-binding oxidoreductase [Streptomyces sp. NBC_00237]MCX5206711.1 FAD-binding oxidoreductase [Streptomyces sp. NBC_00237]